MQVHHDEGVANRIGPEPCAVAREGIGEASAGERIGQPLSRESTLIPGADVVPLSGRQHGRARYRERPDGPAWSKTPGMCGRSLRGNREIPRPTSGALPVWSASGRRGAVADDART